MHGHRLAARAKTLAGFDSSGRRVLDRLFPGLTWEAVEQASLGTAVGGLGWKTAADTARPASVAGHTTAYPKVLEMIAQASKAGLVDGASLRQRLDREMDEITASFLDTLDGAQQVRAEAFLVKAAAVAAGQWRQCTGGERVGGGSLPRAEIVHDSGDELMAQDGAFHAEEPSGESGGGGGGEITSNHVQKELGKLFDITKLRRLETCLEEQGDHAQCARLRELRHPEVAHSWLWHLDTRRGGVLAQSDFILCVQKRLGARMLEASGIECSICGSMLDPWLHHSETCAHAEATRGHYAAVRAIVDGIKAADPGVTTEPRGLTASQARPADIFTNAAVPGRRAALDVCVASPQAAAAGADAADAAFRRKLKKYKDLIPELDRAGISFRPMVWTADGRPHPAATRTLRYAAELAARKGNGAGKAKHIVGRWKHEIAVAIARRRAAMARAVQPKMSQSQKWLLAGRCEEMPTDADRLPSLSADDDPQGYPNSWSGDLDDVEDGGGCGRSHGA